MFIELQMLVWSLSAATAHKSGSSFPQTNSSVMVYVHGRSVKEAGRRRAECNQPDELEPNSVKMGCGNTAKSLRITRHMAVFSAASVTKLRAQGPSSCRPQHMHTYIHAQTHIMLLIRKAEMAKMKWLLLRVQICVHLTLNIIMTWCYNYSNYNDQTVLYVST